MTEGATDPLRRRFVKRGENVVHVADVERRVSLHDGSCTPPHGFVRLEPCVLLGIPRIDHRSVTLARRISFHPSESAPSLVSSPCFFINR